MRRAALALSVLLCACSAKRPAQKTAAGTPPHLQPEPSIRGSEFAATPELRTVRFDFDDARLSPQARTTLRANAETLKKNAEWEVLVEGHCDERGTIEYNLALGQKRAKAVRDYYLLLGVPGRRVATRSLGEEAPACPRSDEGCWAENRRAETKIKTTMARKRR